MEQKGKRSDNIAPKIRSKQPSRIKVVNNAEIPLADNTHNERSTTPSHNRSNINSNDKLSRINSNTVKKRTNYQSSYSNRSISPEIYHNHKRVANQTSTIKAKKDKTSKLSGFKKVVVLYASFLGLLLLIGTILFYVLISESEKLRPVHIIEQITTDLSFHSSAEQLLTNYSNILVLPDGTDSFAGFINNIANKNISFAEDVNNSTMSVLVYRITGDGNNIANVSLKKDGTGVFGLDKWTVSSIDITDGFPEAQIYTILSPDGCEVSIDGKPVDDNAIVESGIPEILKTASKYLHAAPKFTTYEIKTISSIEPVVSGIDEAGNNLEFVTSGNVIIAQPQNHQELSNEVDSLVKAAIKEWGTYFIYMSFDLESYILPECEIHDYIFGSDNMDPILTWLYNYENIVDYEFTEINTDNYIFYSDECFSVDVDYNLAITFDDENIKDDNQNLHATWIWIRNGDSWVICDQKYR